MIEEWLWGFEVWVKASEVPVKKEDNLYEIFSDCIQSQKWKKTK